MLVVGATEPHKNQVAAITAVRLLRDRTREDLRLNIVGPPGRAEADLATHIRQEDPRGVWATRHGVIDDDELKYCSAL